MKTGFEAICVRRKNFANNQRIRNQRIQFKVFVWYWQIPGHVVTMVTTLK